MGCVSCFKVKATLVCGLCQEELCKACAQFMDDENFAYLPQKPPVLSHDTYCPNCFDKHVAAELVAYEQMLAQAKTVPVYLRKQSKETQRIERTAEPVVVKDCTDRNETLVRLAFQALQGGYTALVDVELTSVKIRPGNYQSTVWQGVGVPVLLDESKLLRDRSLWQTPN